MFNQSRRWIATVGIAATFGLVGTTAVPVAAASTVKSELKAGTQVVKKTHTTRQS